LRDPVVVAALKENLRKNNPYVALFMARQDSSIVAQSPPGDLIKSPEDIYQVGVLAQIYSLIPEQGDSVTLLLYPHRRVRMTKYFAPGDVKLNPSSPLAHVPRVLLDPYPDRPIDDVDLVQRVSREIVETLNEMGRLNPLVRDQIQEFVSMTAGDDQTKPESQNKEKENPTRTNPFQQPSKLADFAAAMSDVNPVELQDILETASIEERLKKSLVVLKKELRNAQLQHHISEDLQRKIGDRDREYFLQERLKTIQRELGVEMESREKVMAKYRARAKELKMPEPVLKVFNEELNKLQNLKPAA
jgi:ATP-dependent Lon protease